MTKKSETIVFFGSGPVAATSLELLAKDFKIEAVITKPQPPHHQQPFPVLVTAEALRLPIFTPTDTPELSELFKQQTFASELGVVIDYGYMISKDVIDYFPLGIINSHFSVLPEWRGADPISFAILSGQPTTGVSLMLIDEGLDTGKVLVTKSLSIHTDETTPSLTERLIVLSNELLQEYLPKYVAGKVQPRQQSHPERATYSRKLEKQDGILDFTKPAAQLEREIRAYQEWPKSRTSINDKSIIITSSHVTKGSGTPGEVWKQAKEFGFYTTKDILAVDRLKPAGKPEMSVEAFLAGYNQKLSH